MLELPYAPIKPKNFKISSQPTSYEETALNKSKGKELLKEKRDGLRELQQKFYADGRWSVLIILQGMDASGKDSAIRKIFSGINPQGCEVTSFKAPTNEELKHDYLWRCVKKLPEQGMIGIFNRSYYEEVLVAKVYKSVLEGQNLPSAHRGKTIWKDRYEDINSFEKFVSRNGTKVIKFYLNISKKEQSKRLLDRVLIPSKHWKVGTKDLEVNRDYLKFEKVVNEMITNTSTRVAPWHIIPADDKWYAHLLMMNVLIREINSLKLRYPKPTEDQLKAIAMAKKQLKITIK